MQNHILLRYYSNQIQRFFFFLTLEGTNYLSSVVILIQTILSGIHDLLRLKANSCTTSSLKKIFQSFSPHIDRSTNAVVFEYFGVILNIFFRIFAVTTFYHLSDTFLHNCPTFTHSYNILGYRFLSVCWFKRFSFPYTYF